MTLSNREIANIFDSVADMLELKGEIVHRVLSYRHAADAIRETPRSLSAMAEVGELKTIPSIGKTLEEKIQEMLATGTLQMYENLKAEIPPGLTEILHVSGVGPKRALRLWKELGIADLGQLKEAAEAGKLRAMSGMGAKTEQRILEGIEQLEKLKTEGRTPLGVALPIAQSLLDLLMEMPQAVNGSVAGSLRRARPTIGDIDLLVASDDPQPIIERLGSLANVARVLWTGPEKTSVELLNGKQVDLLIIPPDRWGAALHHFTGSQAHNIHFRELALEKGLSLSERGFKRVDTGEEVLVATEEEVFALVGMPYIPPEIREDWGEIEAALENRLPDLITLDDMHADLHMHTTWSDGTLSIREMANAALARGRKFIVITDHSRSLGITNGLSIERLLAHQQEIRQVDREMGGKIRVFHGTEMEITADGTLDYPDEVLEKLDFVIASLHTGLRQPREQVTMRILNAINNPHVDLIGHPRGQLIPNREPADLDMDAVFQAAKASGIALEINANPHRLDLEAQYARRAVEMGIPLSINTDAHRAGEMDLLHYGILTARRGWVEPASVINTWSLERFLEWAQKRGR